VRLSLTLIAAACILTLGVAAADGGVALVGASREHVGCTAEATQTVVRTFVRSYSSGHVAIIDRLWAPAPRFQWFSTRAPGARLGGPATDRTTLLHYFRSRIRRHEKLTLTQLGAGYDKTRGIVDFGGKLVRSADDMGSRGPQDFKGAADCLSGRPLLIVWSM
jgi:hypothetical protein